MRYGQFTISENQINRLIDQGYLTIKTKTKKSIRLVIPDKKIVLVYGTARTGGYNNRILEEGKYLGTGELNGYQLYSLGSYPAIRKDWSTKTIVEAWKVSIGAFKRLDRLEKQFNYHPEVEIANFNGREIKGTVYVYNEDLSSRRKVESGDWIEDEQKHYADR